MCKKTLRTLLFGSVLLVNSFAFSLNAIAALHTVSLPIETAKLKESILPGYNDCPAKMRYLSLGRLY